MNREQIKEIFLASGFTIKEGQTDLKEYVYQAAETLLRVAKLEQNPKAKKAIVGYDPATGDLLVATMQPQPVDIDVPFQKIVSNEMIGQHVPSNAEEHKRIEDMVYKPATIKAEVRNFIEEESSESKVFRETYGSNIESLLKQPDEYVVQFGLPVSQEPKYTVNGTHIVNRATGEAIPHDEPVFILRAKDRCAVTTLQRYLTLILNQDISNGMHKDYSPHYLAVEARMKQFRQFYHENPTRMKYPDTNVDSCPVPGTDEACERCMTGEGKCLAMSEGNK